MPNNNPPRKYFKTQGELINHYTPLMKWDEILPDTLEEALIHAYELGAMHHSEDTNFELAEFDSNWEQGASNEV